MKIDWNWIVKFSDNNVPSNAKEEEKKRQQFALQFVQWATLLNIANQL